MASLESGGHEIAAVALRSTLLTTTGMVRSVDDMEFPFDLESMSFNSQKVRVDAREYCDLRRE